MGLYKTSISSIFTFITANDLKFCRSSYLSCVYRTMKFKGSNGKVCKMMTSRFRTRKYVGSDVREGTFFPGSSRGTVNLIKVVRFG